MGKEKIEFSSEKYKLGSIVDKKYKEVVYSYIYKGEALRRFVFVKTKRNFPDSYYIDVAKKQIEQEKKSGQLYKYSEKYARDLRMTPKRKGVTAAICALLVAGVATGATLLALHFLNKEQNWEEITADYGINTVVKNLLENAETTSTFSDIKAHGGSIVLTNDSAMTMGIPLVDYNNTSVESYNVADAPYTEDIFTNLTTTKTTYGYAAYIDDATHPSGLYNYPDQSHKCDSDVPPDNLDSYEEKPGTKNESIDFFVEFYFDEDFVDTYYGITALKEKFNNWEEYLKNFDQPGCSIEYHFYQLNNDNLSFKYIEDSHGVMQGMTADMHCEMVFEKGVRIKYVDNIDANEQGVAIKFYQTRTIEFKEVVIPSNFNKWPRKELRSSYGKK